MKRIVRRIREEQTKDTNESLSISFQNIRRLFNQYFTQMEQDEFIDRRRAISSAT
jgi:hypothetical protein